MKKVLVVGPDLNQIGGISNFLNGLLTSRVAEQFDLIYFDCFFYKNRVLSKQSSFSITQVFKSSRLVLNFIMILHKEKPDLVYLNTSSFWGFWEKALLIAVAKIFRIKVIITVHGASFLDFYRNSKVKNIIIWVLKRCSKVSFVSLEMFEFFRDRIKSKNIYFIPVPVSFCSRYDLESADMNIVKKTENFVKKYKYSFLTVSLLEGYKRIEEVIGVFQSVANDRNDVCLVIAGDGSLRAQVDGLIKETPNALYIGEISGDTKNYVFDRLDCFIMNSKVESFGITIVEALLFKKLLLTTNVGIIKSEKENLDSIILMPQFDKQALEQSIKRLSCEETKAKVAKDSDYICKYTWERLGGKYNDFLLLK